ncbi:MAG: flagellar biosynthesis anti-sigma factor FlgM [Clostridiales bacterium]|jgi:negative regulator of flagellin synthesis FlgM|nr:flagellar biosynthesis anti-sigma factor FlgM [Clostridiales bacterium]
MDIRAANVYNAYSVYNTKNTPRAKEVERSGKSGAVKDEFSLSNQAGDYQTVRKVLVNIPDVRMDRVNQVKAKIEAGAYHVSASDVADKILQGIE